MFTLLSLQCTSEETKFIGCYSSKDGAAFISNSNFTCDGCEFSQNNFQSILADDQSNLTLIGSSFSDNIYQGDLKNGGAIQINSAFYATIDSRIFLQKKAYQGGTIYISQVEDNTKKVDIQRSIFSENTAQQAGAIYFINYLVYLQYNTFEDNIAQLQGGAIKQDCRREQEIPQFFSNIFQNNKVLGESGQGGAISYDSFQPFLASNYSQPEWCNFFINNSAQYGPDLSSVSSEIILSFDSNLNNTVKIMNCDSNSKQRSLHSKERFIYQIELVSGQQIESYFEIVLIDQLGQVIYNDYSSELNIYAAAGDQKVQIQNSKYTANKGIYDDSSLIVTYTPGSTIQAEFFVERYFKCLQDMRFQAQVLYCGRD